MQRDSGLHPGALRDTLRGGPERRGYTPACEGHFTAAGRNGKGPGAQYMSTNARGDQGGLRGSSTEKNSEHRIRPEHHGTRAPQHQGSGTEKIHTARDSRDSHTAPGHYCTRAPGVGHEKNPRHQSTRAPGRQGSGTEKTHTASAL